MSDITYIFGGSFDPVHEGHLGVVHELLSLEGEILIAPTVGNPLKGAPSTSLQDRIEMLKLALDSEQIPYTEELGRGRAVLCRKHYVYAKSLIHWLRDQGRESLAWVVGPDLAGEVRTWRDWDSLSTEVYVAKMYADDLHASDVRKDITRAHPAIREFIQKQKLYL